MDRLDELAVFTAILDAGSLAAAARRLRRSTPAVSRALAALEERLGLRLVERTTRRLAPTAVGLRFAERARGLLADYGDAVGEAGETTRVPLRGLLRVTAPVAFGRRHVTPLVASFLDTYPGMRLELICADQQLDLIAEGVDVAVRAGRLTGLGLVARKVGEVRPLLVASADYVARRGVPGSPRDLPKHDVIYYSGVPSFDWRFRGSNPDRAIRLSARLLVSDIDAMLIAVRAGRGIARALSYQVADELLAGTLVRLLREFEPPAWPIHLVVPTARHMLPSVRMFLDHAARHLQALRVINE
jgi:DNA-binding transcriptional LysR family regulator